MGGAGAFQGVCLWYGILFQWVKLQSLALGSLGSSCTAEGAGGTGPSSFSSKSESPLLVLRLDMTNSTYLGALLGLQAS